MTSPNNIECPSYTEEEINDKLKFQEETNSTDKLIVGLNEIDFQDRERSTQFLWNKFFKKQYWIWVSAYKSEIYRLFISRRE